MKQYSATLLAVIHMLSAITLLALSAWFIAACAIAGHAGVLAGFNYVIPAAVIRFLAIIRLGSGYFEKYFGHLALLENLKNIRARLLFAAFHHEVIKQSDSARTLQQETENAAARWSAIYSPLLTSAAAFAGLSLLMTLLFPALLPLWFGYIAATAMLLVGYQHLVKRNEQRAQDSLQHYLFRQRQWLHTCTLWPLTTQQRDIQKLTEQAITAGNRLRHQQTMLTLMDTVLLALSLFWLIAFAQKVTEINAAGARWAVPFIVLISVRDWLLPAFTAVSQPRGQTWGETTLTVNETSKHKLTGEPGLALQLRQFQWVRQHNQGVKLNFTHNGPGVVLFSAPSGSGKSSTFAALTGELPYHGEAVINGRNLKHLTGCERVSTLNCAEQFGHIFSGTLRQNLIVAAEKSDSDCIAALRWAQLAQWANQSSLDLWIGDGGQPISGGEQKRLLLARAYLSDAPTLLLDEPFEALDEATAEKMAHQLTVLAQNRLILIATHIAPKHLQIDSILQGGLLSTRQITNEFVG